MPDTYFSFFLLLFSGTTICIVSLRVLGVFEAQEETIPLPEPDSSFVPPALPEEVTVHLCRPVILLFRGFYSIACLSYFLVLFTPLWIVGIFGVLLFGTGAWYSWHSKWKVMSANAQGIWARTHKTTGHVTRLERRLISWAEISQCEIVIVRNTYGRIVSRHPLLRDGKGEPLIYASFLSLEQRDKDALIGSIRKYWIPNTVDAVNN